MLTLREELEAMHHYQANGWETTTGSAQLNREDKHKAIREEIYGLLVTEKKITDLLRETVYANSTLYKYLDELIDDGKVRKIGNNKPYRYGRV